MFPESTRGEIMAAKKACVIHTPAKKDAAEATAARLQGDGYEVCVTEVTSDIAGQVKAGAGSSLPSDVAACLDGADICVILVDDEVSLGAIGGLASDAGCRVITVGGAPDDLPTEFDDIVDGHVPGPDSPELPDVVDGDSVLMRPDGTSMPRRKPKRVKCQ